MKQKQIEKVLAVKPARMKKTEKYVTAQTSGEYLILDLWVGAEWSCRHAVHVKTGEYASCNTEYQWTEKNLENAFADYWTIMNEVKYRISTKDRELVLAALGVDWPCKNVYERVCYLEKDFAKEAREQKEYRRRKRIDDIMDKILDPGKEVYAWLAQAAVGDLHYAFYDKQRGEYHCTACTGNFTEKAAGVRMKHKGRTACPLCGQVLVVEKRRVEVSVKTRLTMIQNVDEKQGVERHFEAEIVWDHCRNTVLKETIRCLLYRAGKRSKYICQCYFLHYNCWENTHYWDTGNPGNYRWKSGYLYPAGIREGLEQTSYVKWKEVFPQMAAAGIRANYNRLIVDTRECFIRVVEYLFKGRFYRLLEEESEKVDFLHGYGNYNALSLIGENMEEVLHLWDRQKINRLRQENGGTDMLGWLQWEEKTGRKIGSSVLAWHEENRIASDRYIRGRASKYLSPEKLMHYLERQKTGKGKNAVLRTFETYEDYLSMAEAAGKNMTDKMVHRPRELKRRHDELVEEHRKYMEAMQLERDKEKAREEAERMKEKYPGSEEILAEIKPKYEYKGKNYLVTVPENFFQITMEGMALHHCVGNTERYFDRILQHETYICFLRRKEKPEEPFYTLEVEPGGTIRQHRGMYDEEPGIEEIKPFLREWQQEIRRRMSAADHEHARLSAIKREQNLEELRQKNNTKVLKALLEDLMEVV